MGERGEKVTPDSLESKGTEMGVLRSFRRKLFFFSRSTRRTGRAWEFQLSLGSEEAGSFSSFT